MAHPAENVQKVLEGREQTVAVAESLTGGRLSVLLTATPGSSTTYLGGVVSYATEVKVGVLEVPQSVVDGDGVVSAACAVEMAKGVRALLGATYGLSTTGVAGPADQEGKPPGTVFVGVAGPERTTSVALELVGDRAKIVERTCEEALAALADVLEQEESGLG